VVASAAALGKRPGGRQLLGDVAGERHELRAELVAEVGRCAAASSASRAPRVERQVSAAAAAIGQPPTAPAGAPPPRGRDQLPRSA
jgi:hypothetical protein